MLRRCFCISRPFAIALSVFILLNLFLALQNPESSATRVWLNVRLPEPLLSVFAALLGAVLLLPHEAARNPRLRWLLGGVVFGFCILVGANVIGYYHRLNLGAFRSDFPLPFSLAILVVLLGEFARISWWGPVEPRLPPPARVFVGGVSVAGAFFVLILMHIVTFGLTDYRQRADAAVILGAKVYDDGTLSPALRERVETGVRLYREGLVSWLVMSGGIGPNGVSEPAAMARHAEELDVPRSRIVYDEQGDNTRRSAQNCGRIAREYGLGDLLVVSQPFHCARIKLIFEREGTHCYTVPARGLDEADPLPVRLSFFLLREALAYPFYFLYYR